MTAQAATLSFTLNMTNGSDSSDTDVVLTDIAGGVNMAFTVNDTVNNADLAAIYFDIMGYSFADLTIPIDGVVVTDAAGPSSNIQAGNIGQVFDVGVAIGATGSGSDFFDAFDFDVLGSGLSIAAFYDQTFAVRGQSVGPGSDASNPGNGSSKEFGMAGTAPGGSGIPPVPLPAGLWLLAGGLGCLVLRKHLV
ncbi:MAG: VPLPA-CTERM sorting domain-containing protein [Mangrovicoccus sp.]|nr:VPLPA-CTERM sorting domain-containing protein [Mangrovicoccus sp.]